MNAAPIFGPVCRMPNGRVVGCEYVNGDPSRSVPHKYDCACARCIRLPHFKYTGESRVLMTIDVDMDADLLIVGQPENGAYEWVIVSHGKVEKHSDCGYGQVSIALRDGLIAYHGMPETVPA